MDLCTGNMRSFSGKTSVIIWINLVGWFHPHWKHSVVALWFKIPKYDKLWDKSGLDRNGWRRKLLPLFLLPLDKISSCQHFYTKPAIEIVEHPLPKGTGHPANSPWISMPLKTFSFLQSFTLWRQAGFHHIACLSSADPISLLSVPWFNCSPHTSRLFRRIPTLTFPTSHHFLLCW